MRIKGKRREYRDIRERKRERERERERERTHIALLNSIIAP